MTQAEREHKKWYVEKGKDIDDKYMLSRWSWLEGRETILQKYKEAEQTHRLTHKLWLETNDKLYQVNEKLRELEAIQEKEEHKDRLKEAEELLMYYLSRFNRSDWSPYEMLDRGNKIRDYFSKWREKQVSNHTLVP